jgi:hypothetical protein
VGDGSPGSREAEGEGSEGFYIAQSGRCPDLLVIWGGGGVAENIPVHVLGSKLANKFQDGARAGASSRQARMANSQVYELAPSWQR